ncbi:MAG: hypothetical protein ACI856_001690 [Kiritimatiellia bacterium]
MAFPLQFSVCSATSCEILKWQLLMGLDGLAAVARSALEGVSNSMETVNSAGYALSPGGFACTVPRAEALVHGALLVLLFRACTRVGG